MIRPILLLASLALAACAMQTTAPSSLRSEFAPTGPLRVAVNYGNIVIAQKHPSGGEPLGVGPDLARELARRLGVPIQYAYFDIAGKATDALSRGELDLVFVAVDPQRANEIAFSAPYVQIEGTYMVRRDSPLARFEDFDRQGLRIAVGLKSAYDLYLARTLKSSELVRFQTSQAAIDAFVADPKLDAAAGVKNALEATAQRVPGLRVIDGHFMVIGQAVGVPKGRDNAARYLRDFVEEAKRTGFVAESLRKSGITDATVAPAAR